MKTTPKFLHVQMVCVGAALMGIAADREAYARQGGEAWVQRYSCLFAALEGTRKVVTDADGDVIVAGYTSSGFTGEDWVVLKYSNAGMGLWTNRFNGPGNDGDRANAVAGDGSGTVFVTGYSAGTGSTNDFTTIAYSGAGVPLWTNRYNGPGNGDDSAKAIAVDGNGNVFITGYSVGSGGATDFATIAYSGAGVPLWTNRYNGPGNANDSASAIAVDGNGNVFVTGYSAGSGSDYDYATVAYSSAGVPFWTNRYNGAGTGDDSASAIAVDGSGSVFVTGYSIGSGSDYDYATIAYSSAGVPLWTNGYSGPGSTYDEAYAVAADDSGHVFVTGTSSGYTTIAYSSAGVPLWTNSYVGPGNGPHSAAAMAVDASGKVFVTGYSHDGSSDYDYATIAYSSAGVPLWLRRYNGPGNSGDYATAVAVDHGGNLIVTGISSGKSGLDGTTIKYSGAGLPLWTNRYNGLRNGGDYASAVAADTSGNVFVTGNVYSQVSSTFYFYDWATLAYTSDGVPLWTNRYDGPLNNVDYVSAVAVDGSGGVFVVGSGDDNATVIKYSGAGVPLFTNLFRSGYSSRATAAGVDGSGNLVVTGYGYGPGGIGYHYVTLKYSGAGLPVWTNRYDVPANSNEIATDMALDGNGNVFVTGNSVYSRSDYATVAYSSAGVPLWTNRYNGPGNGFDYANAIAVDGNGNVFVTGYSEGSGSTNDYATVAYSSAGVPIWTNRYNGLGNSDDSAKAIAVDGNGNVFVTGYSVGSGSACDYATIGYSNAGVPLWTNRYDGPGNGNDYAWAVGVDGGGNVVVTGYSLGSGSGYDFATIAYSSAGVPLWTNRYNGPANGDETMSTKRCLAVAPDGVIVVGDSDGDFTAILMNDYAVVKYFTASPLKFTSTEKIGTNLRLRFNSRAGYYYHLQARANLAVGDWINVLTNVPSSGAASEITVTNALLEAHQFYRLQQLP